MGVQQCQVEDWLRHIRLRVGDDARVIIVSTHCRTGGRIARINQHVLRRDFGPMIAGFHEVDSLVLDPTTSEMVGVAQLKELIARTAAGLEQMGMPLNRLWRAARDELLALPNPHLPYVHFAAVCARHRLDPIDTRTLTALFFTTLVTSSTMATMSASRTTSSSSPNGLSRPSASSSRTAPPKNWTASCPTPASKRYGTTTLRRRTTLRTPPLPLLPPPRAESDVSYRLEDGTASLVAQHVPQVRPQLLGCPKANQRPACAVSP